MWIDLFAPIKIPDQIVRSIRRRIQKAVTQDNGFIQSMSKLGGTSDYRGGAAFIDFLNKVAERIKASMLKITEHTS